MLKTLEKRNILIRLSIWVILPLAIFLPSFLDNASLANSIGTTRSALFLILIPGAFIGLVVFQIRELFSARVLDWKSRLEKLGSLQNIGLVWAGGKKHPANEKRSMHLSQFAPLAELSGISWISLQKGPPSAQLAQAPFPVLDWTSEIHDFSDTAALIQALDGVVTVDTAVAHLAGAMGKPVWILLPFLPDFRWLLDRGDSPWYPTARLIRQTCQGDWRAAVQVLGSTLSIFRKAH